jgi:hypothetical protein
MIAARLSVLTAFALAATGAVAPSAGAIDLQTHRSYEIVGARSLDFAGEAVAPAGDVNGDGIDDVLIAAPHADAAGREQAGVVYVVFGRRRSAAAVRARASARIALAARVPAAQGFRIIGPHAHAGLGLAIAPAGDVDGDGLDDVVLGVGDDGPVQERFVKHDIRRGVAYVLFGRRSARPIDLAHLGTAGARIGGAALNRTQFGFSVAGGRDVDGDGRPDVVVSDSPWFGGRPGVLPPLASSAYVLSGRTLRRGLDTTVDAPGTVAQRYDGANIGEVSLAADMDGDRRAELVITDNGIGSHVGGVVAFGRSGEPPASLIDLRGRGFTLVDSRQLNQAPRVRGGGDVNGDGRGDLVAITYVRQGHERYAGVADVVFGAPSGDPVSLNRPGPRLVQAIGPSIPFIAPPPPPKDLDPSGWPTAPMLGPTPINAVDIVGDADGDGLDDVIVGGVYSPRGRRAAGSAFLFRGRHGPGRISLSGPARGRVVRIDGARPGDLVGFQATSAGDFDGDGRPDLLVSGPESTRKGRTRAGAAWILTAVRP